MFKVEDFLRLFFILFFIKKKTNTLIIELINSNFKFYSFFNIFQF
jgi:hypothetical protein